MFRWLALCLVLCAGAFALVAMATGAFNRPRRRRSRSSRCRPPAPRTCPNEPVQVPSGAGLGRGGAVFIKDARLTAIEREEVPSQHDGTMLVVGTDEPAEANEAAEMLPPIRVPFLALEIDAKDKDHPVDAKDLPPESQWLFLRQAPDSKFQEAFGQARLAATIGRTTRKIRSAKSTAAGTKATRCSRARWRWCLSRSSSASCARANGSRRASCWPWWTPRSR